MRFLYSFLLLCLSIFFTDCADKKKIIVFTSHGGGGHISVASALSRYLEDYEVETVNFADEVIPSLDLVNKMSFGYLNGEEFYNKLLKWQWNNLTNFFYEISLYGFNWKKPRIEDLVSEYLKNKKVDLVISVIPIINFALVNPLKELNIPLLILPTDLDINSFVQNMQPVTYDRCKINLSFNIPEMRNVAEKIFNKDQIVNMGFPIRPEFFKNYDKKALKKEFNIPENTATMMILMGALGSYASYKYVKVLARSKLRMHLLVCLGRNPDLEKQLKNINLPKNITMSIIGFTDKIPQLMAISDGIITKSGTISICESLYMGLPILIDGTKPCLKWEKFNHKYIKSHGFGNVIDRFGDIESVIYNNIYNQKNRLKYKNNMKKMEKNNFKTNINKVVKELLN